jgi:VWFA-related protein
MPRVLSFTLVLTLVGGSGLVLSQTPAGQPEPQPARPLFRTAVTYVEVDARVLDEKGNAVQDLKQEDFELFEDNKVQKIENFSRISLPAPASESASPAVVRGAIDADVVSSVASRETEGRLYVIVLDDRQIAANRTRQTIQLARNFIEKNVGARDLTAVVSTSGRTDISQNFTANKQMLLRAVDGFVGRKVDSNPEWMPYVPVSATGSAVVAADGTPIPTYFDDDDNKKERYHEAKSSLQALESLTDWLGTVRGRSKALIYISEGLDYNYEDVNDGDSELILAQQRDTIAAATRANVTIYPIDPRGLGTDDTITVGRNAITAVNIGGRQQPLATQGLTDSDREGQAAPTRTMQMKDAIERAHMSLRLIAEDTGGFAVLNSNNPAPWLERIVTQSSSYYLLGYVPTNNRKEGKFRNIRVRVKRPGLRVVARKGYIESFGTRRPPAPLSALATTTSVEARELLNGAWPIADLPLTATAVAFRGQDARASVAVIMESPGDNLALADAGGKTVGEVEVTTVIVDQQNAITAGQNQKISFNLSPENNERIKRNGFRTLAKLDDLKPGRYQLRLGVVPGGSSLRGSLWYDLDVPDFSKGDLAMSGILLSSVAGGQTPTGNPAKLFVDALTLPPTTVREFKLADELNIYAEIYDNQLSPPHQVDLTVTVKSADDRIVYRSNDWASSEEMTIGKGAYPSTTWIPLEELGGPGNYVLHLQAQRALDGTQPIERTVPFKVVK